MYINGSNMFHDMVVLTQDCARAISWTGALAAMIAIFNLVFTVWWTLKVKKKEKEEEERNKTNEE